jgi:hypothetical protein
MRYIQLYSVFIVLLFSSCEENVAYKDTLDDQELFLSAVKQLTDVIVYDIFSPPVASRIYAYSSIAAYETIYPAYNDKYMSLSNQLNGLELTPKPVSANINYHLASIHAFLVVGKAMIFSEDKIEAFQEAMFEKLKKGGISNSIFNSSIDYGNQVAQHILDWADKDMYKQTRSYPKYSIQKEDRLWKPTPPDYIQGIEPHWNEINTMVLDSSGQFPPIPPVDFDLDESSEFFRQLKEVYDVGVNLDNEERSIASFWDCNPFVTHHKGHAMFATKKITPGGHWMSITAIACKQNNTPFDEAIEAHALVSLTLFDAFISSWDEKYNSLLVRPETLINQYIDEDWMPLLQTPPFPEYTSAHSVISRASAVILTNIFGENFAFNDTSEVEYGISSRNFNSFFHASEEAAISRLYGGIHYMMAIENGVTQGEQVGNYIINNVQTRVRK